MNIYNKCTFLMKKFILSENGLNTLKHSLLIENAFEDNIIHGKDFLTANYKVFPQDNGKGGIVGVFVKMDRGIPTSAKYWKEDVIDALDKEFQSRLTNDDLRRGFVRQLLDDWYNNKISKNNSLTNYDFLKLKQ